jgi:hypothetical protein
LLGSGFLDTSNSRLILELFTFFLALYPLSGFNHRLWERLSYSAGQAGIYGILWQAFAVDFSNGIASLGRLVPGITSWSSATGVRSYSYFLFILFRSKIFPLLFLNFAQNIPFPAKRASKASGIVQFCKDNSTTRDTSHLHSYPFGHTTLDWNQE